MRLNRTDGKYSRTRKLSEEQVREIINLKESLTYKEVAEKFKIHPQTVSKIWRGAAWKSLQGVDHEVW